MISKAVAVPSVEVLTHLAVCPHCGKELRVATKYLGEEVTCRFCSGQLRLESESVVDALPAQYQVVAIAINRLASKPHIPSDWPGVMQRKLNEQAMLGYRFLRAFPVGEHLAIVFQREVQTP